MSKMKKRNINFSKKMEIVFLGFYVVELLPLYIIAFFDVPSADDYSSRKAVGEFANIFEWIKEAWDSMVHAWRNWQGTYSAYFWSTFFHPLRFSDKLYFIVPIILLLGYSAGMFALCYQSMHKVLKIQKSHVVMVYVTIMSVIIQFMPSVVEGVYWYSGGFLYTFFFSLALAVLAYFIYLFQKEMHGKKLLLHNVCLAVLIFIIEGSNYPTAILMLMVLGMIMVYTVFFRREKILLSIPAFLASLSGLLLSALAPGNTVRMASEGVQYIPSLEKTLLISFRLGFQYFRTWFTIPVAIALVIMIPILFDAFKNSRTRFRHPLIFSVFSMGIFCGMYAPSAYSYGWIGPGRYMNIVYAGYVLLLFTNEIYFIGWFRGILNTLTDGQEDQRLLFERKMAAQMKKYIPGLFFLCAGMLFMVSRPNFYTGYSTKEETYTSVTAVKSLCSGEAQNYYRQFCERRNILMDTSVEEPEFAPYYYKPLLLYFDDITSDCTEWRNVLLAGYYEKESVVLTE